MYGGVEEALLEPTTYDYFSGKDGLGDFHFGDKIISKVNSDTHAAIALIQLANEYPKELTVLCLGRGT